MQLRWRVLAFIAVLFAVATLERYAGLSPFVGFLVAGGTYLAVVFPALLNGGRR